MRMLTSYTVMALVLVAGIACSPEGGRNGQSHQVQPEQGNLAPRGGSPTVREPYTPKPDDPGTTNDESNDQPVGHFGTRTMIVSQRESGHTYTLDVELEGFEVSRIYFPRGGWVDLEGCELEEDFTGECVDENGRHWTFEVEP